MEDASPATFRPTGRQSLGRGLYLGAIVTAIAMVAATFVSVIVTPPGWLWLLLAFGPLAVGAMLGPLIGRWAAIEINAGGIRGVAPWHRVVDLRAERRGGRTVVSVYLDSGVSVQLQAPYDGDLFAADPRFELKMFALSHIWRSNRFGGLPG